MCSPKQPKLRLLLKLGILCSALLVVYFTFFSHNSSDATNDVTFLLPPKKPKEYNVWLIFTKVSQRSPLRYKFHNLLENILNISSVPLKFHIIVDNSSKHLAVGEISDVVSHSNRAIFYKFYDIEMCAKAISDIVDVMTPHFSSKPGTYYSDALFYISLGLYRIAPPSQQTALLLDCDLYFKKDIRLVFEEFDKFKPSALYGLAPELTPVYRHVLQSYKVKKNSTFGEYYHSTAISRNMQHPRGFQGYNSGVVLINLDAIRKSKEYSKIIRNETVQYLTSKYKFRGHLGDQDFYTLMGFEYPDLIQTINCGFNRQLCVWWREHGYRDVFDFYFKCQHPTVILHGNCNTKIPK
ncbi:xyloside xylosyltransferase 1 isoform X1 [Tribolium madens]|uniref:xyloside xylosyltransferase 1 isoform X1 n=1 Tax=Tribolium madens TaxID=41895 RepID=UPI001CF73549|nr:xyloside xylosyltransferase 1 isoform X1 [Tribolium madens]